MKKHEHRKLIEAIDCLESNPCKWEDAMNKLYALVGLKFMDHREQAGESVSIYELAARAELNKE